MFIIGITGGIGSGKSTFASLLHEAGLPVIDADQLSHEMTAANGRSMKKIKEIFGEKMLQQDGSLNRKAMAELAFQDKKALDLLSRIIHEDVFDRMDEIIKDLEKQGASGLVLDVPIPVEHGFLNRCNLVCCIWADDNIRLDRLVKRGLPAEEARRRMAVQMTKEKYKKISHYFIMNNGSLEDLRKEAEKLLQEELASRGIPYRSLISPQLLPAP